MGQIDQIIDIDLSHPLQSIEQLHGDQKLRACIRFRRRPLGWVELPIQNGRCDRDTIAECVLPHYKWLCQREMIKDYLLQPGKKTWAIQDLLKPVPTDLPDLRPLVTVAYCLCDRRNVDFRAQLQAIAALDYPQMEVLVVEALPADAAVQQCVTQEFPQFTYHSTPEWGLNAARNLAIRQAQGEIVAWLDHQATPEPEWVSAIVQTLHQQPSVDAVTGLILPQLSGHPDQARFASHHAYERGFEPRRYAFHQSPHWSALGTSQIGSGANFACRRSLFDRVGPFDPALDIPGQTDGGGDFDLFLRALMQGATLLYAPWVVAQWQPPLASAAILQQCQQRIRAFFSAGIAGSYRYPQFRWQFFTLALWRFSLILMRWVRTYGIPRSWSTTELKAALSSWKHYQTGLQKVAALPPNPAHSQIRPAPTKHMAVRTINLDAPIPHLHDIQDYKHVRLFLAQAGHIRAKIDIHHQGRSLSAVEIATALAEQQMWPLLAQAFEANEARAYTEVERALHDFWLPPLPIAAVPSAATPAPIATMPIPEAISIIIPTCDRPDDLRQCLTHLQQQQTARQLEIIVADNRPRSGLTPQVLQDFPQVRYIAEPRAGSSYARNSAIAASHGEVIVMVDDDVTVPADWLEKLLAPLADPKVAAVTGNLLPLRLDTEAQWVFEDLKGGLTQGWQRIEADRAWLDSYSPYSPPTWDLGVSANAAFRTAIFADPRVGLMDEVLGAGTPCCGGEENHLVYKLLRANYTLVYEPQAYAWHHHRQTMQALHKQWHGYMRSATCYHLTLWLKENDNRAKYQLFSALPKGLWGYVCDRIKGKHQVPWAIVRSEVTGYIQGFWGYYKSSQRVKQVGRSAPYIPPQARHTMIETNVPTTAGSYR